MSGPIKRDRRDLGPAAAAMKRRNVFRDNRASEKQLTAEQIIAEAEEMQRFTAPKRDATRILIYSAEELALHRQQTRSELETRVTRGYSFLGNWIKYALWECQQKDFSRMRAVMERAMKVHGGNPTLWQKYAELEMSNGFEQYARVVWDRAVTALPSCDDLWLRYLVMEQAAMNDTNTRDVFTRWMQQKPAPYAWKLFVAFEAGHGRIDSSRDVLRRLAEDQNSIEAWLFYGQMEHTVFGCADRAIAVYETAIQALPPAQTNGEADYRISVALAQAYVTQGEPDRARSVYRALLRTTRDPAAVDNLLAIYSRFERVSGAGSAHDQTVTWMQAKAVYEQRVLRNEMDFDAWLLHYIVQKHEMLIQAAKEGDRVSNGVLGIESAGSKARALAHSRPLKSAASAAAEACKLKANASGNGADALSVSSTHEESIPEISSTALTIVESASKSKNGALVVMETSKYEEMRREALAWLARAIAVVCRPPLRAIASQQQAALVVPYVNLLEESGDAQTARTTYAALIRRFPFELASCPRLWIEAAALEQRTGNIEQARKLLGAGIGVSGEKEVFEAALALEAEQGDPEDRAKRCRNLFEAALRKYPLDEMLWCAYAKFEAELGQRQRCDALFNICITRLTAAASVKTGKLDTQSHSGSAQGGGKPLSLVERYTLYKRVDSVWAQRISQMKRSVRSLSAEEGVSLVLGVYKALFLSTWSCYVEEFDEWKNEYVIARQREREAAERKKKSEEHEEEGAANADDQEGEGEKQEATKSIASSLPNLLLPAIQRWSDAVEITLTYLLNAPAAALSAATKITIPSKSSSTSRMIVEESSARLAPFRQWVREVVEQERLRVSMAAHNGELKFYELHDGKQWTELMLTALFDEWRKQEKTHGTPKTLEQISTAALPTKARRTRLFGKKN